MSIESATFLGDLQPANPPATDPRGQGDDHLRLIKQVLQNSFPGLEKAIYFPTTTSKTADFTVLATDMNNVFLCDTTAGIINMTLPALLVADKGWECFMLKTSTNTNPVLIKPPSGTLTSGAIPGLSAARRCIPGSKIRCFWSGTGWLISRAEGIGGPVGSAVEYHGSTLPYGFEFPNGTTLGSAATNYPEYNAVIGSGATLDKRGRIGVVLDNLGGGSAGRLAGGVITGTAIGNTGGLDVVSLLAGQIPAITSNANNVITVSGTSNQFLGGSATSAPGGGGVEAITGASFGLLTSTATINISVTSNNTGGGSHSNLQPSIMVSQLLVTE